jgi:hypothetical protein
VKLSEQNMFSLYSYTEYNYLQQFCEIIWLKSLPLWIN